MEGVALGSDESPEQRALLLVVVEQSLLVLAFFCVRIVALLFALPSVSFVLGAAVGD